MLYRAGIGTFNEYLEEDGLLNALEYRKKNNEMGCNGREFTSAAQKLSSRMAT
jgi:hypothetical protein